MIRKMLTPVLATVVLGLAACGGDDDAGGADAAGNGVDRGFVAEMVPHHQSAVDMAEIARKRGESTFVRELASDIMRTQNEEIGVLQREDEGLETAGVKAEPFPMPAGMMGMDMDTGMLETAEPFDTEFVNMMIPHHESAVEMGTVQLEKGEDPELKALAQDIIDAQEREIREMRDFLAEQHS